MILFPKQHTIRRFETVLERGASVSTYRDITVLADVQRNGSGTTTQNEGNRKTQKLKAWSNEPFQVDDQNAGQTGDWILKDGFWYRCISCQRSNNTLLDHYVSEFELIYEGNSEEDMDLSETEAEI